MSRLSQDRIRDCDLRMRLLDSSVGAFAITSLRALFRRSRSTIVASSPCALTAASLLYWTMHFPVLRSCTSGTVIVRGRGCCDSGTVIPLFKDRCSAKDLSRTACAVSAL